MAQTAQFIGRPKIGIAVVNTANANRDGSGTLGTVFSAGDNGSRVLAITVRAIVTTTAGMVRLFIHDGSAARLWREIPVSSVTVSASVPGFNATIDCSDLSPENILVLPPSYSLRASTHNAESFVVTAVGGDY